MTVHIVGVGPGDPELLTVRAARLLRDADAVVYDRLIGPGILDHASPLAERYDVGKAPGRPGPTQDEINELLVSLGSRLDTVVRVKGGDPFVFGRGIEELRACRAAGIAAEVTPGITSALAGPAVAGVSVTERGVSSGVLIVTAHQDDGSVPLDWSAVASVGVTVVVLMGARRAALVAGALLHGGLAIDTPVAVAVSATHPDQHVWRGCLGDLGHTRVPSPAVLVIGPAVGTASNDAVLASTGPVAGLGSSPVGGSRGAGEANGGSSRWGAVGADRVRGAGGAGARSVH